MKRCVAVIAACISMTFVANAALAQSPVIGFKLGPTWSKLDFSNGNEDNRWLSSFAGSGFMRFDFSGFSLQPEIMVVTKGSRLDDPVGDAEIEIEYIEFPIGLMLPLGQDRFAPYVMIGPSFAFESQCAVKTDLFEERGFNCDEDIDPTLEHKEFDVGIFGSVGLNYRWGPGQFVLEGRYTYGLVNLRQVETPQTEDVSVKNRSIAVFGGYSIAIGRR
jgi:Outer membrane protein beta-barrel domain